MRFKTSNIKEATHTGMFVEQKTSSPKNFRLFNELTVILQIQTDGEKEFEEIAFVSNN